MHPIVRILAVIALLWVPGPAVAAAEAAPPADPAQESAGQGQILGRVESEDGHPLAGATVVAFHLRGEQFFRSEPSNPKGAFSVDNLPFGYYDVAVETAEGVYVGNVVVNVPPAGKAILVLTVAPFGPNDDPTREFTGTQGSAEGVARVTERLTKKEFWKSPRGIAILGGVGGVALLVIAAGDNPEEPATPF